MKNNFPLVSVIIPVYNAGNTVLDAINSIICQSYSNLEIIVINDGSTDNTESIVNGFHDDRIVLINKKNSGIVDSLNVGILHAKGIYIARMDADDVSVLNRIEKQVEFMERHPDLVCCGTSIKTFGDRIRKVKYPISDCFCKDMLLFFPCFAHPSVIYRKSIVDENSIRYDEEFTYAEDYKFWVGLSKYGKLGNLSEVGLFYRVHNSQISSAKRYQQICTHLKISCDVFLSVFNKKLDAKTLSCLIFPTECYGVSRFRVFSLLASILCLKIHPFVKLMLARKSLIYFFWVKADRYIVS